MDRLEGTSITRVPSRGHHCGELSTALLRAPPRGPASGQSLGMTIPNFADAPALLTDTDVLLRVEQLVGHAVADRTLWIMWVDGDGRQAPVVMPVEEFPRDPEPAQLDGLATVLGGLRGVYLSTRRGVRRLR